MDSEERVYVVSSHIRGAVLVAMLALAPWMEYASSRFTCAQLLVIYSRMTVATVHQSLTPENDTAASLAVQARRAAVAYAVVAAGAIALVFVPRRFARTLIASATWICAGTVSEFAHSHFIMLVFRFRTSPENYAACWIAADLVAWLPLAVALVSSFFLVKWRETSIWLGGALALFCLPCLFVGGAELVWGARAFAVLAASVFWREARRWDELPRPDP